MVLQTADAFGVLPPIAQTRAMIAAALSGELAGVSMRTEPTFGFSVPMSCPAVPAALLDPRTTRSGKAAYDALATTLAGMFAENVVAFADRVPAVVVAAGPHRE